MNYIIIDFLIFFYKFNNNYINIIFKLIIEKYYILFIYIITNITI